MRHGFTLLEMLIVIAIIALIVAASMAGYSHMTHLAEKSRCQELVSNAATALAVKYAQEGCWKKSIASVGEHGALLDADNAKYLAAGTKYFSLNYDSDNDRLRGFDRFGIVTPWAMAAIKTKGTSASLATKVSQARDGSHSVQDHILRFAIDTDGDGFIKGVNVGGQSLTIRAQAVVWCCGRDGKLESYSEGLKRDDVYSWAPGQVKK